MNKEEQPELANVVQLDSFRKKKNPQTVNLGERIDAIQTRAARIDGMLSEMRKGLFSNDTKR
jgi:tRNA U34 5-methylaminomethyl-2-thiouridine-forming methyltransferase MnmC